MLDDKPLYTNGATPEKDTKQVPGGLCLMGRSSFSHQYQATSSVNT